MRSEFDELKRFAIADILSVSGKQKTTETINMHFNTIIDIAFLKGQQSQQSKIDELQEKLDASEKTRSTLYEENVDLREKNGELQKRVVSTLKVVQSMRNEVKHGHLSDDESQTLSSYANDLEQALKGGSDE